MRRIILITTLFLSINTYCQSVIKPLKIGDTVPEEIYRTFTGSVAPKLTILDFWSTYCFSCIEAFPKMQELQKGFPKNDLRIVLVNSWENDTEINKRMATINTGLAKRGLKLLAFPNLSMINVDTILKKLFPARFIPHHVWIDNNRKVVSITSGYNATSEHVRSIISGEKVNMEQKDDIVGLKLADEGYLQPTIKSMPPIYYSAFIPYFSVGLGSSTKSDSVSGTFRISEYNAGILDHFRTAFRNPERVIYALNNKEAYLYPKDPNQVDDWKRKYCFTYEIQGRLQDKDRWQQKMQQDVNYFFGNLFGIQGAIEKRKYQALVMIKVKDGLLKTSGGNQSSSTVNNKTVITNMPFKYIQTILKLDDFDKGGRPFVDETGFTGNVDMTITGDLSNVENVRKQLQPYGLDIIEAEREINVLVISDTDTMDSPPKK